MNCDALDLITYATIEDIEYPIDTSLKAAIRCESIINDLEIDDYERAAGIITVLFGMECPITTEALEKACIYLGAGEKVDPKEKKVMDYFQDWDLIYGAFKAQYGIDLYEDDLHYQKFIKLLKGLRKQVLNDVIELRTYDLSTVKDAKQKRKIIEAQKKVALKEIEKRAVRESAFLNSLNPKVKGGR